MRVSNVRAVHVPGADVFGSWTIVGDEGRPVADVEPYIRYLHATNASPQTIKTYARHLALFFRWLDLRDARWEDLSFEALCLFADDLADGTLRSLRRLGIYRAQAPRSPATCEAVLAAIHSFLDFWELEGRAPADLVKYRAKRPGLRSSKTFLAHVARRRPEISRRLRVRGRTAPVPQIIEFDADFSRLVAQTRTDRDQLLLSAMYDGGLRISQALGLRHEDIDIARQRITVEKRRTNVNLALSKSSTHVISMPSRFFQYYKKALLEQLLRGVDSDYLFVNLNDGEVGAPMRYVNAYQVVTRTGVRAGLELTPHTLRHTHATALAIEGWSAAKIAHRLGQKSASSAEIYIHLRETDYAEDLRRFWHSQNRGIEE